jgi:UDPglucose 6-dehydrogenase
MKITVVGTGYVGLVTGACFAEIGLTVTCIDIDKEKIDNLQKGIIPIYEPRLDEIVHKNVEKKRLMFSTILKDHLDCEAVFIAVGTPAGEDGSADLKYVLNVASEIGKHIIHPMLVVIKSTVPIGSTGSVKNVIREELSRRNAKIDFYIGSNPEFLKEGSAVEDFLKPDRIIVGVESEEAADIFQKLYKPFLLNGHPLLVMDITSSEMTKYAANAMLATKISFMNDIANLCDIVGADVTQVRKGIGSDPRIGTRFIYPGIGYGGSCFPKDVKALVKRAEEVSYSLEVLKSVDNVNERQKKVLFSKIEKHFENKLKGKHFAFWGLAYKPQTDDMREAPSLTIIKSLIDSGATVCAYDPAAMNECRKILHDKICYAENQYDALKNADALVLVTEWPEFRLPDFKLIETGLKNKVVFDGRNIFDPLEMKEAGYAYYSIGRASVKSKK